MKETKDYYIKKQRELNEMIKELNRGKKSGTYSPSPTKLKKEEKKDEIPQQTIELEQYEFLQHELQAKQQVIEELKDRISKMEKETPITNTSQLENNLNDESEILVELRKVQREKEELERKLELSEMNKEFIKENAMEQVRAAYAELSGVREKHRLDVANIMERHTIDLKNQEQLFMREIEDYKHIIDNTTKPSPVVNELPVAELSTDSGRIIQLKQLMNRIETIESKHKIREMELERELNETKYRYELKLTALKQQLDLTVQQKNQQVLQLKSSLDNLVTTLHKLKMSQAENFIYE